MCPTLAPASTGLLQIAEARVPVGDDRRGVVIGLQGELDVATVAPVRERIAALVDDGTRIVVVDLRGVTFLGATGLGVLAGAASRLRRHGGELALVRPERGPIARVMRLTGMDQALPVHLSPRDAVEAMSA